MDKESEQLTKEIRQLLKNAADIQERTVAIQERTVAIQERTVAIQERNAIEMEKLRERMEKQTEQIDKQSAQIDKQSAQIKEQGIQIGGLSNNVGHHAEQFFQNVFKEKLEFGRIKYDEMIPNLTHKGKKYKIEFDIALINGDSIALIEAKNRIHPDFVIEFAEERIEKFREYFHEFDNYDVYLGIAGFSFSDEVLDRASTYGIGIVRQVGEGVEIEANNLKVY